MIEVPLVKRSHHPTSASTGDRSHQNDDDTSFVFYATHTDDDTILGHVDEDVVDVRNEGNQS